MPYVRTILLSSLSYATRIVSILCDLPLFFITPRTSTSRPGEERNWSYGREVEAEHVPVVFSVVKEHHTSRSIRTLSMVIPFISLFPVPPSYFFGPIPVRRCLVVAYAKRSEIGCFLRALVCVCMYARIHIYAYLFPRDLPQGKNDRCC